MGFWRDFGAELLVDLDDDHMDFKEHLSELLVDFADDHMDFKEHLSGVAGRHCRTHHIFSDVYTYNIVR